MQDILKIKRWILLAGDLLALTTSLPIMLFVSFRGALDSRLFLNHLFPFLAIYFFIVVLFYIGGLYDVRTRKSATSLLPTILLVHVAGAVFGIIIFYLLTDFSSVTPKTNLALAMAVSTALVWGWRSLIFQRFVIQHLKINVAIAGINEHAKELMSIMNMRPYLGYQLIALIHTEPFLSQKTDEHVQTFFADKNLIANLQNAKIDTVITAENPHLNPAVAKAFYECIPYKIQFLDLAQSYELLTGRIPISYINQTWFLENINESNKKLYDEAKRIIDICAAAFFLLISAPFWPLIALAIKWESAGPVFYAQERVGANKKLFRLIKFRSMIKNAEQDKPIWAQKEDRRVTRVGMFLRKTHLDELPQMFNILQGDISLIGPRPERTEFVRELERQIPHYNIRHIIKPGFTGWAQINFRYARTPMDTYEKFQYDLYYLKNRSLILDIAILLKTVTLFFKKEK